MLIRSPCILCGALDGAATGQFCQDCYTDLPSRPAGVCLCCGVPASDTGICIRCFARPPAFDCCIAGSMYRYPVDLMIKRLKYQARLDMVRSLSRPLIERIRLECFELPDCLVPTPLHSSRQRSRGFNQAREIARVLAQNLFLPVDDRLVRRHKATAQQYDLRPEHRERNVKSAFSLIKSNNYRSVAIVDDVLTTGATANELARLLKRHGSEQVQLWCLARAAPYSS